MSDVGAPKRDQFPPEDRSTRGAEFTDGVESPAGESAESTDGLESPAGESAEFTDGVEQWRHYDF